MVSHPSASNSPLNSNTVDFNVVADSSRKVIYVEEFDINATLYNTQEYDLVNEDLEIIPDEVGLAVTSNWNRIYSLYAPESDVTVKITMSGAAGGEGTPGNAGGEGGISIWTMTLTQQQEYVVNLGARIWPSGGSPASGGFSGGGNGGGGSFFFQGGELLVACGGGGGGGGASGGSHGFGGGIGVNAELTSIGYFPYANTPGDMGPNANRVQQNPGQVARCTIGDYWQTQGIAPCVSIGSTTFFTGKDGQKTFNFNGVTVTRGYKAGLNYQFNGGNGDSFSDGGGGGGARGGQGSSNGDGGGGGGQGFAAIPIDSATISGNEGAVGTIKIEAV